LSDAYGSIEECFVDIPEPEVPTVNDFDYYIQRGLACRGQGDVAAAIASFSTAIKLNPKSPFGYYHRAFTYDGESLTERAIDDYSLAIDRDPLLAMAYGSRGIASYSQKLYREAASDLNYFLELMPDSLDAQYVRAAIVLADLEINE